MQKRNSLLPVREMYAVSCVTNEGLETSSATGAVAEIFVSFVWSACFRDELFILLQFCTLLAAQRSVW